MRGGNVPGHSMEVPLWVQGRRPLRRHRSARRLPMLSVLLFTLGLSIPAPVRLIPSADYSPSLTDLLLLLILPIACKTLLRRPSGKATMVAIAGVAAVSTAMASALLNAGRAFENSDWIFYFRWGAACIAGPALVCMFAEKASRLNSFFLGIVAGSALHVVTLMLANAGFNEQLIGIGLSSPRAMISWAGGQERFVTLANHPNAAMILISLAVPAALAVRAGDSGKRVLVLCSLTLLAVGFYLTLSRAAMIAAFAALVTSSAIRLRRSRRLSFLMTPLSIGFAVILLALLGAASGTEFDNSRLAHRADITALAENLEGRWGTVVQSWEEIARSPLGTGWSSFGEEQRIGALLGASHNGYLFAARTIGLPLALLMLIGHVRLLWRGAIAGASSFGPFAAHFLVLMFAEDITQGASLVLLAMLLASWGMLAPVGRRFTRPSVTSASEKERRRSRRPRPISPAYR